MGVSEKKTSEAAFDVSFLNIENLQSNMKVNSTPKLWGKEMDILVKVFSRGKENRRRFNEHRQRSRLRSASSNGHIRKPLQIISCASKFTTTPFSFSISSSTSESITAPKPTKQPQLEGLTQEDLTKINLFFLRICLLNHFDTTTHLAIIALLANPPLESVFLSVSLSVLIHSFTSQPDLARPMLLLTRLRHNLHSHTHLMPIATMVIASYFKKNRSREAFKMFSWLVRLGSQCVLDERVCEVLVNGFCRKWMVCEGLKILKAMLGVNIVPGGDGGKWVYRGLLREARIKEAVELNEVLGCGRVGANGDESEGVKKVLALLDHMIFSCTN
ncbi:hypothetical protein TB1_008739 [Malus domestica]|uniref:Pentatricopeptide repeat-containing protein n=1 Tax=Malus domestica TaxID=3750 RepID=A0A498IC77_MALDO|nr:hypothetical protein DVH24_004744 [Malus domestica]